LDNLLPRGGTVSPENGKGKFKACTSGEVSKERGADIRGYRRMDLKRVPKNHSMEKKAREKIRKAQRFFKQGGEGTNR